MTTILDGKAILNYLPHRYPFLLLDRVTELDKENNSIVAYKNISMNEPWSNGHFVGSPIFPGVMAVEAMAQACTVLGFYSANKKFDLEKHTVLFSGIDDVRFKKMVIPGDKLVIKSKLLKRRRQFWYFDCHAFVDDILAAKAQIMCTFISSDEDEEPL